MRLFQRGNRAKKRGILRERALRVRPTAALPVEVQIIGKGSLDVLRTRDLSVSGVGVWVEHRFAGCDIESPVELVITLPRSRPFLAKGIIRHLTQDGEPSEYLGVELTELSRANREQIAAYVAQTPAEDQ